jgi:ABC-2 type transport system permease protein
MNVYRRELRAHWKSLAFWCLGMVLLMVSGMAKFETLNGTGQGAKELLDQLPRTLQVVFGLSGFDVTTVRGYYGVMFFYVALMATVHAVLLGTSVIAGEEVDHTAEFLLVRPVSRRRVVAAKMLYGLTAIVVLNLVTAASSVYSVNAVGGAGSSGSYLWLLLLGLLFLQTLFFLVGTCVAGVSHRPRSAGSIATTVLLVTYLFSILVDLNASLEPLKYFSPFRYFDAHDIIGLGRLNLGYVALTAVLIAGLAGLTYRGYERRDLVL